MTHREFAIDWTAKRGAVSQFTAYWTELNRYLRKNLHEPAFKAEAAGRFHAGLSVTYAGKDIIASRVQTDPMRDGHGRLPQDRIPE